MVAHGKCSHGVEAILPICVLDTFSPPRDDYLKSTGKVVSNGPLYLGSNSRGSRHSRAKSRTLCEKHAVLVRFQS